MSQRVFALEDDAHVAAIVRIAAEQEGWQFLSVATAGEALAAAERFAPDLILLDVEVPDGDGFSVCRQMRGDPALSKVPVIFLTFKGDVDSRLKGFAAGGQDYVAKPFAVAELKARVRAHLGTKGRLDALALEKEHLVLRDRLRKDMMEMIVHDLRTPLSSIKLALEIVRDGGIISDDQFDLTLRRAEGAADFALLMVNDLLDLSAGTLQVKPASLDMTALAKRLEELFAPYMKRRGLALKVELAQEALPVTTDDTLLLRILANLISTAAKFSREGQTVRLRTRPAGGGLRLEVIDQSPGIPAEQKEKIFEKYWGTGSPANRAVPGASIGLAFCRMAADLLGGRIWAEDAQGGGNCFVVEIPSSPAPVPEPARSPEDLVPPEVIRDYLQSCQAQLAKARALPPKLAGPLGREAIRELRKIAHQLAGSAGSYGFPAASEAASRLQNLLTPFLDTDAPRGEKLAGEALSLIERLGAELGPEQIP